MELSSLPPVVRMVAVVSAKRRQLIRLICIHPWDHADDAKHANCSPQEAFVVLPPVATVMVANGDTVPDPAEVNTALAATLGTAIAPATRCALIDKSGTVVNAVMGDPEVDGPNFPDHTLVPMSDQADIGWAWTEKGGFVAPKPDDAS